MEKLKQRVVSSSSRVIASLQQAAAAATPSSQSSTPSESGKDASGRLAAANLAAAHLTEQEREILHEVFKKEEQFRRETIKQMTRTAHQQEASPEANEDPASSRLSLFASQSTPTSSSAAYGKVKINNLGTPTTRPGSTVPRESAGRREQRDLRDRERRATSACSSSSSSQQQQPTGQCELQEQQQCRICRKQIPSSEPSHLCSTCNQFICDDCASYSATDQHWMCSSCRRRATKPAIPADALRELGLNQDSSAVRRMTLRLNQTELKQVLAGKKASLTTNTCPSPRSDELVSQQGAQLSRPVAAAAATSNSVERSTKERIGVGPTAQPNEGIKRNDGRLGLSSASDTDTTKKPEKSVKTDEQQHQHQRQHSHDTRRPKTLVTASSERSLNGSLLELQRTNNRAMAAHPAVGPGSSAIFPATSSLVPMIPADQIHLRRLSDQSNLVRRSSIIANNEMNQLAPARNRSHSNIDTAAQCYSTVFCPTSSYYNNTADLQQTARRPSWNDQWAGQHYQQPAFLGNREMAALITSYEHKRRRQSGSAEEIHSDSSSDINDNEPQLQSNFNQLSRFSDQNQGELEEPNEYFAAPRALSSRFLDLSPSNDSSLLLTNEMQQSQHQQNYSNFGLSSDDPHLPQPSIPSVSVSEFSSSQQRLFLQQQQQQQQQQQAPYQDPIMTTPTQINLAIERAIQRQQRRQSNVGGEFELLPGDERAHLMPRRASSGRVLPKIPGEQSRSLLELPHLGGGTSASGGQLSGGRGDGALGTNSTLDLPCLSPTIRRASAPEGQNIKIVVDDMDTSLAMGGSIASSTVGCQLANGKQVGQLYERIVLYRDDSLDPNTNMARGFGLQLMGGKILPNEDKLQAVVTWVLPGGPADKLGIRRGDHIIEWDGKCLVNMTYEQVAEVVESSANIAELLVKPAHRLQAQPNYVRSQRRLSHQTERDLRRHSTAIQPTTNGYQKHNPDFLQQQQQTQALWFQQQTAHRAGTGRRLPQIPGIQLAQTNNNSSSTSKLEQINGYPAGSDMNYLATARHEQQSHSTGELYTTSQISLNNTNGQQQQQYFSSTTYGWSGQGGEQNGQLGRASGYQQQPTNRYEQPYSLIKQPDEVCGLIGLQVNVDERVSQLEISVLSAINVIINPNYDYYVRVRILPENSRFKACSTQPSSDLNWKETFIFQNFPIQQIQRMALEIGIWVYDEAPRLSTQIAQPICEALIPIQSARERNTDFWPLRAPPTSPQVRRKSLNDLLETHSRQEANRFELHDSRKNSINYQQDMMIGGGGGGQAALGRSLLKIQAHPDTQQTSESIFTRERSSSNRNLPDTSKLIRSQPRRASDEVACNSSHKLSARVNSATGRRSISVMNVGDGLLSRPSSRLGSQSNILKLRRDSAQQSQLQLNSSVFKRYGSPSTTGSQTPVGTTPSGRRSSLVGIQSMTGYRSQKSSQSGSTDQDSPMRSISRSRGAHQATISLSDSKQHQRSQISHKTTTSEHSSVSSEQSHPATLQRKGSYAMQTLRKLKRTMSLNKGTDNEGGSNQDSRRSSSSSTPSDSEVGEDLAVARRFLGQQNSVGRLKLSFIMTKGQLEIDVLCAKELNFDHDNSLGVYVKIYLKEKSKTNKRKTRLVQPCESPVLKQVIKYDASLVDNKSLDISVWQKQGGLKGKNPIGFTEIRLSELKLEKLQISWYNLRPMDTITNSSIED